MVKVGDTVKWDAGSKGMLGGKVTGGEKGKRWKIEKAGKTHYVLKDKVKKGIVKKSEKKPAPAPAKKPAPKYPKKAKVPQKRSKMFPVSTTSSPDKPAPAPAKKPTAKKPAPKKPAAKKPVVDKNLLQNVMGIMATVGKEKGGKKDDEKQEEILLKYSIPQLKKAYNSALDEKKPGFKQPFRRGTTKINIIGKAKKEKFNLLKFLTDKPKKDPTKKYILEGWNLIDDDRDDDESGIPYELEDAGFKFSASYPSGLIALEANLSVDQLKEFVKDNEENYEDYSRLYTETKRYKRMVWDGFSS